jgi:hypothetical protein
MYVGFGAYKLMADGARQGEGTREGVGGNRK